MINAQEAAKKSKDALDAATEDLKTSLQKVIDAAIKQGSCKAAFFPRNKFESENSIAVLQHHGYDATLTLAKDQRDNDRIDITWG